MERLKDLGAFGVWFLGLSYIVMWALTGPLNRVVALDVHPESLPQALHVAGVLAAIAAFVRLLLIAIRSARGPQAAPPRPQRRFRRPDPTVKKIRARDHFGLRGIDQ